MINYKNIKKLSKNIREKKKTVITLFSFLILLAVPGVVWGAGDLSPKVCKKCHDDFDFNTFKSSKHDIIGCTGCHKDIKKIPHNEEVDIVKCERCHKKAAKEYSGSIHARALKEGITEAPHCWDCHGSHDVLSKLNIDSHVYPTHIPSTCGSAKCHSNAAMAKKLGIPMLNPLSHYNKSIHAKTLASGNLDAATCEKCHGGHDILPLTDPKSPINKKNVPETCSQCHDLIYDEYKSSIHWTGFLKGVRNAPVCTDCHLEHEILSPENPKSMVSHEKVPTLCTDCHNNTRIAKRYGLPVRSLNSYLKSFHGLALKSGNYEAADCTSCHAAHAILKSDNPESTVNSKNLSKTCGACHPGIILDVKNSKIHAEISSSELLGNRIVEIVRKAYIAIIVISVGGMFIFCMIDLVAKTKRKRKLMHEDQGHHLDPLQPPKYFERFNKLERAMHMTLMITFFILVYTGFARSFPDSAFAYPLTKYMPHTVRDYLHRIAGVIITLDLLIQIILMFTTKRGKEQLKALLPRGKDLKDAVQFFRYNTGAERKHPSFDRFSFIEKFEYWALVWGSIVMAVSGIALWFKEITLKILPYWVIDLAQTLHFYEAILASLAILIWHFYWVIFNPDVYPLDTKWITGKISEEHLKHEHYLEWERINNPESDIMSKGIPIHPESTLGKRAKSGKR